MSKAEEIEGLFGWVTEREFRSPLPVTQAFPSALRPVGNILGVPHVEWPPYLVYGFVGGVDELMLCRSDGWRACHFDGGEPRGLGRDDPRWIYADGDNVPSEWKPTIQAAIAEIREKHPKRTITFRPRPDFHHGE